MATPKVQLTPEAQNSLLSSLNTKLKNSPTAYTPNTAPTNSDLNLQLQLMNLNSSMEKDQAAKAKAALYGSDATTDINNPLPPKEGLITRGLSILSDPLYGIVGAAESALGKGSAPGLENITANMREQQGFGSLLNREGVNKWVSMPLGFALDVAADPVNWLTAGTEATIPKVFEGLKEGGLEGGKEALKSSVLTKASKILRWTPFIDHSLNGEGIVSRIASLAGKSEDAFRAASGLPTVIEEATSQGKSALASKLTEAAKNIPGAETFRNKFLYSPSTRWADLLKQATVDSEREATGARSSLDNVITELSQAAAFGNHGDLSQTLEMTARQRALDNVVNEGRKVALTPPSRGMLGGVNSFGIQNDMSNVADEMKNANEAIANQIRKNADTTGIKWYDDLRSKVNSSPIAKKISDTYEKMMGLFKVTKVGLNPTSYTNAVLGNATMAGMMGLDISNPTFLDTLYQTFKMVRGKAPNADIAQAIASSPELQEFVTKYAKLANEINLDSSIFEGGINRAFGNDLAMLAKQARSGAPEDILKFAKGLDLSNAPSAITLETPSLFNNDIFYGPFNSMIEDWKNQPAGIRKSIANLVNKSGEAYGSIDQTFKIGTLLHLHLNGVSAEELKNIAKYVPLAESDITKVGNLYKLSALKAGEVANEAFMNYAAMPSAVRMLRSLPILGSPFASFTYGTLAKTGKALVNNPGFFNKLTFARNEVSQGSPQTPIEKTALASPFYNYLNTYGRVKIPFFQSYPTYLNIANWVPYLGLNNLNPSERQYTTEVGSTVGGVFDAMPFMKTPEGQILFDYIIQPYILGESQPTGQFGQPLYPSDAGAGKKLLSLGSAAVGNYLPLNYRLPQIINAMEGKNAQGIASSKSGYELTFKALLSTLGVPISDVDLGAFSSVVKKQLTPPKPAAKKK